MKLFGGIYDLFIAVDAHTESVLHGELLPYHGGFYCLWFLLGLGWKGFYPRSILSDGLRGYAFGIPLCFGLSCKHQRWLFHGLRNACRKLRSLVEDPKQRASLREQVLEVFPTDYKRTVLRGIEALNRELLVLSQSHTETLVLSSEAHRNTCVE